MPSQIPQDIEKTPLITITPPDYLDHEEFQAFLKKQNRRRKFKRCRKFFFAFICSILLWNSYLSAGDFGCALSSKKSLSSEMISSNHTCFNLSPSKPKLFLKVQDGFSSPIEHSVDPTSELKEVQIEISSSIEDLFRRIKLEKFSDDEEEGILIKNSPGWKWGKNWKVVGGKESDLKIKVIYPKNVKIGQFETVSDGSRIIAQDLVDINLDGWKARAKSGSVTVESITTASLIEIESSLGHVASKGRLVSDTIYLTSQNGAISISDVQASTHAKVHSSMGSISGNFSSPNLEFQGHGGSIRGTFNVSKELKLSSNLGSIDARINLVKDDKNSNEEISVESSSKQGSNKLTFLNEASDLKLNCSSTSSMGKVDVTFLKLGFQGDFKVESNLGSVLVEEPDDDDEMKDYELKITKENRGPIKSEVEGWIKKRENEEEKKWGNVLLKSNLGSAALRF